MVYKWSQGRSFGVDAQVAGEALADIRQANGGHLTPEAVVDSSRDKNAPLHRCFEWNAGIAQRNWNQHLARNVIRSIVVVNVDEGEHEGLPKSHHVYTNITIPEVGRCYMTTAHVVSDEELKEQAIADALRYLAGARARFAEIEELAGLFKAIDRETKKVEARINNHSVRSSVSIPA